MLLREFLTFDRCEVDTQLGHTFGRNLPFPHLIIDNFFVPALANELARSIGELNDSDYGVSFRSLAQNKLQLGRIKTVAPDLYPAYDALLGAEFLAFLESVSGLSGLSGDEQFAGAGLHRYHRNGFSEIHLDSNRHPFDPELIHRLNLLIFLNPNWEQSWGGELVLWSDRGGRPTEPVAMIAPNFNRGVLFLVSDTAWHSVNQIRCPVDQTRNSMAIYYFNRERLAEDLNPRSVIWRSKRSRPRNAIFSVTNRLITRAKPYAHYLRWLRPTKFDGVER